MLRRLTATIVPVVLLLTATACADSRPVPSIAWDTAPSTDEQRLALLAAVRAIDPCALIPRTVLDELGTVVSVTATATDTCVAELNSTEFEKRTRLNWSMFLDTEQVEPFCGGVVRQVAGATVVAERDTEPDPDVLIHTCTALARFPATVGLHLMVSTPVADKPCAVLDQVLPDAVDRLRDQPANGTSPDTPITPLTGADPCATATELGIVTPVTKQFLRGCVFEYRGTTIDLQYSYDQQGVVTQGDPIPTGNGHPGYDLRSRTETYWYAAILGPPLPESGPASTLGPRVPVVKLMGSDPAVLHEVLRHTAGLFPA